MPSWLRRALSVVLFWTYVWLLGSWALPLLHSRDAEHHLVAHVDAQQVTTEVSVGDGPTADDRIADYTFWLTIFTGVLGIATVGRWLETRLSAARSERNQVRLERPQIAVTVQTPGIRESQSHLEFTDQHFRFAVMNYGRTAAKITEIVPAIRVQRTGEFPAPIDGVDRSVAEYRELPSGCVAIVDLPYSESINLREFVNFDEMQLTSAARDMHVFFIGWVRFRDVFENRYICGFCMVFDPIGQRFVIRGNNASYNYVREEIGA